MHRVVLLRHAVAQDRIEAAERGLSDAQRELTPKGRSKMRQTARGLKRIIPELNLIVTSPLPRAMQTAVIVADEYRGGVTPEQHASLAPGAGADAVIDFLNNRPRALTVLCVGHEPDLSLLASTLLSNGNKSLLTLKKGGACLLEFRRRVAPGRAKLAWLLTPRALRCLGKSR
jgi:phosphohistidine phosphatase